MKHYLFIFLFLSSLNALSQIEKKYDKSSDKLPNWVQLMYADEPNVGIVIEEYENFYKTNSFNKNKHTQYYKRWIRSFSRVTKEVKKSNNKSSNNWEGVGPWDFDINAESRSYAPGAAHLYTVEQSKSNRN
jgi:hypothetical protein